MFRELKVDDSGVVKIGNKKFTKKSEKLKSQKLLSLKI